MLFNSLEFFVFLPIVFVLYWFVFNKTARAQNLLIIAASFFFYGWWDIKFLLLLIFSATVDYLAAIQIDAAQTKKAKKAWLAVSLTTQLGILGFFKYYNFFIDSFSTAFQFFGYNIHASRLDIILPVGVSFYTFQTLSYTIDVYRGRMNASRDATCFFAFISFFPQLVAGPIERAIHLLPQFDKPRTFDYQQGARGCRLILWGFFKKIAIGDTAALMVNQIFGNYQHEPPVHLLLGAFYFTIQIYADFSGYSDIARGLARLLGFEIVRNFNYPYFSRDIAEFWRRWHISLSTWFRDYLYFPLGGSRTTKAKAIRNIFIIFLVSGFWHGANWTFVVWGGLNALYFLPLFILGQNRNNLSIAAENSYLPSVREVIQIATTFALTMFAWIFFRSATITDAFHYIGRMFSPKIFAIPTGYRQYLPLIFIFLLWEWMFRKKECGLDFGRFPKVWRWSLYMLIICAIFYTMGEEQQFIYFQF